MENMDDHPDPKEAKKVYKDPRNWQRFVDVVQGKDHGRPTATVRPPNVHVVFGTGLELDIVNARGREAEPSFDLEEVTSPEDMPINADRIIVRPIDGESFEVLVENRAPVQEENDG